MRDRKTIIADIVKTLKRSEQNEINFFSRLERVDLFIDLKQDGFFDLSTVPVPVKTDKGQLLTRWAAEPYLERVAKHVYDSDGSDTVLATELLGTLRVLSPKGNFLLARSLFKCFCCLPSSLVCTDDISKMFSWLEETGSGGHLIEDAVLDGLSTFIKKLKNTDHNKTLLTVFLHKAFSTSKAKTGSGPADFQFITRYGYQQRLPKHFNFEELAINRPWIIQIAVTVFEGLLEVELGDADRDATSVLWRPAVEDHAQNEFHDKALSLLIGMVFKAASALLNAGADIPSIDQWRNSGRWGFRRIYFALAARFPAMLDTELAAKKFIEIGPETEYRHEAFQFLERQFSVLPEEIQNAIVNTIEQQTDIKATDQRVVAWEKLRWLMAIKDSTNSTVERAYKNAIAITEHEPEHPDFSVYSSGAVWVGRKSPFSPAEISTMSSAELIQNLKGLKVSDEFRGPSVDGFGDALKESIAEFPLRIVELVPVLTELQPEYVSSIFDGAIKAFAAKKPIPTSDLIKGAKIWAKVNSDRFKNEGRELWAISSISRLVEAGIQNDDHAFDQAVHDDLQELIEILLAATPDTQKFNMKSDSFTSAINNPRGKIYEAAISLALHRARVATDSDGKQVAWEKLKSIIEPAISCKGEFALRSLLGAYYRQIKYLNSEWLSSNLKSIKSQSGSDAWLSFMDGFSYVAHFDKQMYLALRDDGDLLRYLRWETSEDNSRRDRLENRIIELAVIAYLLDVETLESGTLAEVLSENERSEWHGIIWALPAVLGKDPSADMLIKAKVLLSKMFEIAGKTDRRISADYFGSLWRILGFLNDPNEQIIEDILVHSGRASEGGWDFHGDIEYLARFCDSYPARVGFLFKRLIDAAAYAPIYPDDEIRKICQALVAANQKEALADICVRYSKEFPNGGPIRNICDKLMNN